MSTQPAGGSPDDEQPLPSEEDLTTTVTRSVVARLRDGVVSGGRMPAPVYGEVVSRLGRLYSAIVTGGSNVSRAAERHPYFFAAAGTGSVRITLVEADDDGTLDTDVARHFEVDDLLGTLAALVEADRDSVSRVALQRGGAVLHAYRALADVLGETGIVTDFERVLTAGTAPAYKTVATLRPQTARAHGDALAEAQIVDTRRIQIRGVLDELAGQRGTFKLVRPSTETGAREWSATLGTGHRSLKGDLSPGAAAQARRLRAWSSLVTAELDVTYWTAPTSSASTELNAELLRIVAVQESLDDEESRPA